MQNSERVILHITKRPSRLQNGADYIPRSSGVPQREFCRGFCNVQDYKNPWGDYKALWNLHMQITKSKKQMTKCPCEITKWRFQITKNKKVQSCGKEPEIKTQREFWCRLQRGRILIRQITKGHQNSPTDFWWLWNLLEISKEWAENKGSDYNLGNEMSIHVTCTGYIDPKFYHGRERTI